MGSIFVGILGGGGGIRRKGLEADGDKLLEGLGHIWSGEGLWLGWDFGDPCWREGC